MDPNSSVDTYSDGPVADQSWSRSLARVAQIDLAGRAERFLVRAARRRLAARVALLRVEPVERISPPLLWTSDGRVPIVRTPADGADPWQEIFQGWRGISRVDLRDRAGASLRRAFGVRARMRVEVGRSQQGGESRHLLIDAELSRNAPVLAELQQFAELVFGVASSQIELYRRGNDAARLRRELIAAERRNADLKLRLEELASRLRGNEAEPLHARILEHRALLGQVLAPLPEGVILLEDGGAVLLMNEAAEKLLGLQASEPGDLDEIERCTGLALGLLIEEADGAAQELRGREILWQQRETARHLRVDVAPLIGDRRRQGWLMALRDISARRRDERAQAEFVSTVSHELKTPLTSMRTAVELVRSAEAGPVGNDQIQFLDLILRNIDRLSGRIQQMLDAAREERGLLVLRRRVVGLAEVVGPAFEQLRLNAKHGQRNLELSVEPGSAAFLDPERFAQILENLVGNALKFTDARGWIKLCVRRDMPCPNAVSRKIAGLLDVDLRGSELEVADDGCGMSPAAAERAFDRFYQEADPLVDRPAGTGLGLSITRSLVRAHDGEVALESGVGQGTSVRVWIPSSEEAAWLHGGLRRLSAHLSELRTRLRTATIEVEDLDEGDREDPTGFAAVEDPPALRFRLSRQIAVILRECNLSRDPHLVQYPEDGQRVGTLLALAMHRRRNAPVARTPPSVVVGEMNHEYSALDPDRGR